ncbi:hypothetical protein BDA99DRAFT_568908 [Phascolomyces articulosus]|uniref:Uncharacterized protein n=1 Tax=Phascolomyces articulosus TaxID=60185 RepID=A0AAD5PI92_9FUNG|nr:hypothetical protein BDA99DRAFT_568908 [Phascolomyces articulosus]
MFGDQRRETNGTQDMLTRFERVRNKTSVFSDPYVIVQVSFLVDPFWQNHLWAGFLKLPRAQLQNHLRVGFLKLPRAQIQVVNGSTPLWFKSLWRLNSGDHDGAIEVRNPGMLAVLLIKQRFPLMMHLTPRHVRQPGSWMWRSGGMSQSILRVWFPLLSYLSQAGGELRRLSK